MSEAVQIALLSAVLNAAVTWGIITTKLAWLRSDVDELKAEVRGLHRERVSEAR
jgi:hypothetical protein